MSMLLGVLGMGRRQADSRMKEEVTAYTVTTVVDPVTFEDVDTTVDVYTGVARVKYPTLIVREHEQGTQAAAVQALEVHFPSGTTGIAKDVLIRVDASTADAGLVGRIYRARGLGAAGQTTALRVPVAEVS
jgi:hypothetical protein